VSFLNTLICKEKESVKVFSKEKLFKAFNVEGKGDVYENVE